MVLITPVKFGRNPTSSLTCEGRVSLMQTDGQLDGPTDGEGKNNTPKILGDITKIFEDKII
jgi:hypothetical protein